MSEAMVLAAVIVKDLTGAAQKLAGIVQLFHSLLGVSKAHSGISLPVLLPVGVAICVVGA